MSTITVNHRPLISSISSDVQQSINKRLNPDESTSMATKKIKRSIDVTTHWKRIHSIHKSDATKVLECRSKTDYLIIVDPLGDRSRFVISKSSYYWLNESVRLMQQHVEYGTTLNAAGIGEIVEIERNLKALKSNLEKNGLEKTFSHRAEALLNFIRLCCTIYGTSPLDSHSEHLRLYLENPLEKLRRRLHALFNVCASCWLHMLEIILPIAIVRVEKNFVFDEDYGDFENDSIIKSFRKDVQQQIKRINTEIPNLRHLLYSIVLIIEKFHEHLLIDRVYLERFQMIYEIWMLIDNELNSREHLPRPTNTTRNDHRLETLSWNFLAECQKYEQLFGVFTSNIK